MKTNKIKKIMAFIPAYNAEKTIISVLERFSKPLINRVSEILILDNGSQDNTYEVALNYKKRKKLRKLTVLKNGKNLGYGGSKKRAFKYAIAKNYDIFVMVHSDGQYPPEKALDMVKPIEDGSADLVIGSRINHFKGGMKIWKILGNKALTLVENTAIGLKLHEMHSGYKAYNIKALKSIPIDVLDDDHIISSETIFLFRLKHFRIKEVPIPTFYSKSSTECSFSTSLRYGIDVIKLVARYLVFKAGLNSKDKMFGWLKE